MKFLSKLLDRVNIWPIVNSHFDTFYDYNKLYNEGIRKIPVYDFILFLVLPTLSSLMFIFLFKFNFDKDKINLLVTSLTIFTGLLLSLLVLLFDLGRKEKETFSTIPIDQIQKHNLSKNKITLVGEVFSNVLYSILTSALAILFCLLTQMSRVSIIYDNVPLQVYLILKFILLKALSFVALFLLFQFFLSLLMIIKRFKILYDLGF